MGGSTMNEYIKMKTRHQAEVDAFPMFFAFSNKQFAEGMEKLGLKPEDTDKIYKLGSTGGFYRRSDSEALFNMFTRHTEEMEKAIEADKTGDGFIYDMFNYELANHEYCITYDREPTLDALGMTEEDLLNDPRLLHGMNKAERNQLRRRR